MECNDTMKINKNGNKGQFRQGDVLLVKIDRIPESAKRINSKQVTLALGEVTGHHHTFTDGAVGFADQINEHGITLAEYVEVQKLIQEVQGVRVAALGHQEHEAFPVNTGVTESIEPGTYEVVMPFQYERGEMKKVVD